MSAPPVDLGDLLDLPPILKPEQLGKLFNKSLEVLANDRYFGRGPAYVKYGRSVFYLRSDVIAFLTANRRNPTLVGDR
jgi:hypothetical protein